MANVVWGFDGGGGGEGGGEVIAFRAVTDWIVPKFF